MASPFPPSDAILWVDTPSARDQLADALRTTTCLALDTESNSMFAYRERVCLVQLGIVRVDAAPQVALIDPFAFPSLADALAPLIAWWSAPDHDVLMHGAVYDIAVLKRELGTAPPVLFDTQVAAALLDFERTGYQNLCEDLLGEPIDKTHQRDNWGRRPLSAAALRYAAGDVACLPELAQILRSMVAEADLADEVATACRGVAATPAHTPITPETQFWRTLGDTRATPDELGRLAALVAWREREALLRDQPPGMLVPKRVLLDLMRRPPSNRGALATLGLSRRLVDEAGPALMDALARPETPPPRPPRPPRPKPEEEARRQRLKRWREAEAQRRKVNPQVVLPTAALDAIAEGKRTLDAIPELGERRIERYGSAIKALVEG